jgi:octaprenyl-diphosphate synthase
MVAGASPEIQRACADFGMNLGLAFQIADDVLDYTADAATLGKNLGDDLAEGKATLPLIHAMAKADPAARERLAQIVSDCDTGAMEEVLAAIRASGGLDYSRRMAEGYANDAVAALDKLPRNTWTDALRGLAAYAIDREN